MKDEVGGNCVIVLVYMLDGDPLRSAGEDATEM